MTYDHDAKYLYQSLNITKKEAELLGQISKEIILESMTNKSHSKSIQTIEKSFQPLNAKQTAIVTYTIIEFIKKQMNSYIEEHTKDQISTQPLQGYI